MTGETRGYPLQFQPPSNNSLLPSCIPTLLPTSAAATPILYTSISFFSLFFSRAISSLRALSPLALSLSLFLSLLSKLPLVFFLLSCSLRSLSSSRLSLFFSFFPSYLHSELPSALSLSLSLSFRSRSRFHPLSLVTLQPPRHWPSEWSRER